jgi:two-component sensor histidine kinase
MLHPWLPNDVDPLDQLGIEHDRAQLALTASGFGEAEWDLSRDIYAVGRRMARVTGLPVGEAPARMGYAFFDHINAADIACTRAVIAKGLKSKGRAHTAFRFVRPDNGKAIWLECHVMLARGGPTTRRRIIAVFRDITAMHEEQYVRRSMVAELDQRVKNVLDSVRSLAAQTARGTVSLAAFLKSFGGRLDALASAHTLLTHARWNGASLHDIASAELHGLTMGQVALSGPEVILKPRAAHALALTLHELGVNAVKYGALSREQGRVKLRWTIDADRGVVIEWRETGGPPVVEPRRSGFGLDWLNKFASLDLGGEAQVKFHPEGLFVRIKVAGEAINALGVRPLRQSQPSLSAKRLPSGDSADIVGARLLIVEDASLLAMELDAALSEAGAIVVGVASGDADIARFSRLRPDLALVDLDLPNHDGFAAARRLSRAGLRFALLAGSNAVAEKATPFNAPVILKPFNMSEVAPALALAWGKGERAVA